MQYFLELAKSQKYHNMVRFMTEVWFAVRRRRALKLGIYAVRYVFLMTPTYIKNVWLFTLNISATFPINFDSKSKPNQAIIA